MTKQKLSFLKKIIVSILLLLSLLAAIAAYLAYQTIYQTNVDLGDKKSEFIYIPTGSKFQDVIRILKENKILKHTATFEWLAEKKKYTNAIKPGKYRILSKMNNNALLNLLRSGIQEPVELNFNGIRTIDQLISRICKRIEADSSSLHLAMKDNFFLKKYGFQKNNIQGFFVPNTYTFYWNTSVEEFFGRMDREYKKCWNENRIRKAKQIGFSEKEVITLASIVQSEQCCDNIEKRVIAGLYINRFKREMELESDPTVIFAIGNFAIHRLNNQHLQFNSPFNTYLHKGLPPGPICFVQVSSIDAVLDYSKNDFLFMCAKDDLSGKHSFAKNYQEHLKNAKKYRDALNKRGIH